MKKTKFILFALLLFLGVAAGEEAVGNGEITITCPTGDTYVCYQREGLSVKKGEGDSTVIIKFD